MYYTQEQIDRANQADLVSFLQRIGSAPHVGHHRHAAHAVTVYDAALAPCGLDLGNLAQRHAQRGDGRVDVCVLHVGERAFALSFVVLKLVDPIYTILMEFEPLRELLETLYIGLGKLR